MKRLLITALATILIGSLPATLSAQGSPTRPPGGRTARVWDVDPNGGRLFFAPTARVVPSRAGAVTLYELIMPTLSITLTEDFIFTAGAPLMTDVEGAQSWAISGKFNLPVERKFEAALAAMTVFGGSEIWGFFFGVITVGDDEKSLTGGLGYSYFENSLGNQVSTAKGASVFIGGDLRLEPDLKLVSEAHFQPGTDTIISLGVRFIGEKISVDLGAGMVRPERDPSLFPIINIAWNW
ncbi:hypothetical protein ACFL3X_01285 [Gemmatimonadota bacterium]